MKKTSLLFIAALLGACYAVAEVGTPVVGEIKGSAVVHTASSAANVVGNASVALPADVTGGPLYLGKFKDIPAVNSKKVPVVLFLHGSSGLGLKAIGEWQVWLANQGIASFAPDSFALPDRLTYTSPVDKTYYESLFSLRMSEINLALDALSKAAWADNAHLVLAGASEGAVVTERYKGAEFVARILYSWSCEQNYFVRNHESNIPNTQPVLNVVSANDMYFSRANPWLGNPNAKGYCGDALANNKRAAIVLIPGAPHTVLMLPPALHATQGFLKDVLHP